MTVSITHYGAFSEPRRLLVGTSLKRDSITWKKCLRKLDSNPKLTGGKQQSWNAKMTLVQISSSSTFKNCPLTEREVRYGRTKKVAKPKMLLRIGSLVESLRKLLTPMQALSGGTKEKLIPLMKARTSSSRMRSANTAAKTRRTKCELKSCLSLVKDNIDMLGTSKRLLLIGWDFPLGQASKSTQRAWFNPSSSFD